MTRRLPFERLEPRLLPEVKPAAAVTDVAKTVEGRLNISYRLAGLAAHDTSRKLGEDDKPKNLPANWPFCLPEVPKSVRSEKLRIAQDDQMAGPWNWASQSGMWAEGIGFMGYAYLSELSQRAEYRAAVETTAEAMVRKWIDIRYAGEVEEEEQDEETAADLAEFEDDGGRATTDKEEKQARKIRQIEQAMEAHGIQSLFRTAAEHDGYFGRGQIYVDVDDAWQKTDELDKPLGYDSGKIRKGADLRFSIIEPLWSYPGYFEASNPLKADFYKPEHWLVMATRVHASRLLTFVSRPVPDILKPAYAFGGLALTQMMKPYVDNWLRTRQSVSDLVRAFSIMCIATDLGAQLASSPNGDTLIARIEMFNRFRDNRSAVLIDKEKEDFKNIAAPIAGLADLQAQSQEQMASVAETPLVYLLGTTPKGLNASSEGEIRVWGERVKSRQERLFRPNLTRVVNAVQLSLFGEVDENIVFDFNPLLELSAKENAEVQKTKADTAKALIDGGVLAPEEERRRLANDADSGYTDIDVEDVPEPPQQPDMTGGGEGGEKDEDANAPPESFGRAVA